MELENTGSSDWKSRILSEKVPWEDKPALWLSIEFDEIVTLELSFIELLACLTKAIRPLEPHSLKQFTLCRFWANIVIIPIYRGKTLDGAVWRIPTFLFYGDEEILTEKRSWVRQFVNAEPEVLSQLGIEQQSTKHSDAFQQLERVLAELVPLANHLYCFKEITNKLDRVGYEILEQYFESHVHEMYKLLKRAEEVLDEFFLQFEENEILERVFNRQQLLEALRMGQECLVPRGKPANGKINHLNLTVCGEWAASLMEVIGHLKVIDWMLH